MGQSSYGVKPQNRMNQAPGYTPYNPTTLPQLPSVSNVMKPRHDASAFDINRGNPNERKAAKLVVEEPKAPAAPAAPATPAGPTPQQIAAQQAAAVAAQQAQFWAQHAANQRMKEEKRRAEEAAAANAAEG